MSRDKLNDLNTKLSAFLEVRKESTGDYPEVTEKEIDGLLEIVDDIIELKWAHDCDDDRAVGHVTIIDKTMYLPFHYEPQIHTKWGDLPGDERWEQAMRTAQLNLDLARDEHSRVVRDITSYFSQLRYAAAEAKKRREKKDD